MERLGDLSTEAEESLSVAWSAPASNLSNGRLDLVDLVADVNVNSYRLGTTIHSAVV